MTPINRYSINVLTSIFLAASALLFFYYVLNLKSSIYLSIAFFGAPHFLFASLAAFSYQPKKAVVPYIIATALSVVFALFLRSLPGLYLAQIIFFTYFLIHLLKDEFMLEESAKTGYKIMISSLPNLTQLSLLIIPVSAFVLFGFNLGTSPPVNLHSYFALLFILPIPFIWAKYAKKTENPAGFLIFFICLSSLLFFWLGKQSFETGITLRAFLGLYHFAAWYVFYTKKLIAKSRVQSPQTKTNIIFAFKNSPKSFLTFIGLLHLIMAGALAIYLVSPIKFGTQFVFADSAWQFLTIWHVTTSFLGKTDFEPLFSLFWPSKQKLIRASI